jgi:regulator of protease activity HflC (stomatin/prohibitin superfamily)
VLDEATGKWGVRVNRVEIKAIDPPDSIKEAMEQQMRADRNKRAAILTAEGVKQSQILTAEGEKQAAILTAQGQREADILKAEGQAKAIATVFAAIHEGRPDAELLAYSYLETLPKVASYGNTVVVVPSELTTAMQKITEGFGRSGEAAG